MKKLTVSAVFFVMFGLGSSVAMAGSEAVVAQVTGKVMVDSGKGFMLVKSGAALKEGDRVVALKASNATINFAQGCTMTLGENDLVTVSRDAGCKSHIVAVNRVADPSAVAAIGEADFDWTPVIGLGVIAGAGVIYAATNNSNDTKPISVQ